MHAYLFTERISCWNIPWQLYGTSDGRMLKCTWPQLKCFMTSIKRTGFNILCSRCQVNTTDTRTKSCMRCSAGDWIPDSLVTAIAKWQRSIGQTGMQPTISAVWLISVESIMKYEVGYCELWSTLSKAEERRLHESKRKLDRCRWNAPSHIWTGCITV